MILKPGSAVGPYEIVAPIGAGGMGEVYRARDPRLGRDVAVKVLPGAVSAEPERLRRFEQEARAAGALNHPNVLAVHDVGTHDGAPYIVSELLEGETLREPDRRAPLPVAQGPGLRGAGRARAGRGPREGDRAPRPQAREPVRDEGRAGEDPGLRARQAARPEHRDPRRAGLGVRPRHRDRHPSGDAPRHGRATCPPSRCDGQPADARSDIFSFGRRALRDAHGAEGLQGRRPRPETLSAILKEDPLESAATDVAVAPGLERVLRHCLEKSPDERFQSARDLAFALEALSGFSDTAAARASPAGRRRRMAAVGGALVVATALGVLAGKSWWETEPPRFTQLTFRAGTVSAARFSPDGQTIAYSAAWDGGPLELYTRRTEDMDSRPFGLQRARVLSISRSGELAVQLLAAGSAMGVYPYVPGTLARIPIAGGTPRELLEQTESADWSPDGSELAVSRWVEGKCRLEYPIGHVLYESEKRIHGAPRLTARRPRRFPRGGPGGREALQHEVAVHRGPGRKEEGALRGLGDHRHRLVGVRAGDLAGHDPGRRKPGHSRRHALWEEPPDHSARPGRSPRRRVP